MVAFLSGVTDKPKVVLMYIFLMDKDVEHFFTLVICVSSFENYFLSGAYFSTSSLGIWVLNGCYYLCFLDSYSLCEVNIFFRAVGCAVILWLAGFLCCGEHSSFMSFHLAILRANCNAVGVLLRKLQPVPKPPSVSLGLPLAVSVFSFGNESLWSILSLFLCKVKAQI